MKRFTILVAIFLLSGTVNAADYTIKSGTVKVICPLTVGGSFEAVTKHITGTLPDKVVVDLKTLETGIGIRDDHLKREYLEVDKYDVATMDGIKLSADKKSFTAFLTVHGQRRPVSGTAVVQGEDMMKVTAHFPLKISDYKIAKPTYLGIGVSDQIQIVITLNATGK